MKKIVICCVLSFALCATLAAGCSAPMGVDEELAQVSAQPTMVTSVEESEIPSLAPSAEVAPSPSVEPERVQGAATSALSQLNLGDQFMSAKSLDGIDPLNDKVIALTFDDGPHGANTPRLLDILKQNGAVATFFMVGTNVQEYPDIVKQVYDEGHEIGTHSWNHADLMTLSVDQVLAEQYGKANDAIEAATGLRAAIDRPPYGSMSTERATELGREQVLWNVDPEDWKAEYKNADSIYDNVMNGSNNGGKAVDGAIVLSHDIHSTTIDAYDRIIKALKDQGYKFVTVTQMMQIAELRGREIGYRFANAPTVGEATSAAATGTATDAPAA